MLSDRTIRKLIDQGRLKITAPVAMRDEQFQPASIDLRMAEATIVQPLSFVLGYTLESLELDQMLAGRVEGKSSWARRGLSVHCAGFIDPGFRGQITLELFNYTAFPIVVNHCRRIAQISFEWMDDRPNRVYGDPGLRSRYQDQTGATPAREWVTDSQPERDGISW